MNLLSPCLFGHASDPLVMLKKGIAHWECRRCAQDLGAVLGVKPKKVKKAKARVLALAERKRA